MGVTLYRPGKMHTIRGIKCETKVFNEYSYTHNLEMGWFYSPEECYEKVVEVEPTDKEIRTLAKNKGIKNWYNKKISKLKVEIEACQDN